MNLFILFTLVISSLEYLEYCSIARYCPNMLARSILRNASKFNLTTLHQYHQCHFKIPHSKNLQFGPVARWRRGRCDTQGIQGISKQLNFLSGWQRLHLRGKKNCPIVRTADGEPKQRKNTEKCNACSLHAHTCRFNVFIYLYLVHIVNLVSIHCINTRRGFWIKFHLSNDIVILRLLNRFFQKIDLMSLWLRWLQ